VSKERLAEKLERPLTSRPKRVSNESVESTTIGRKRKLGPAITSTGPYATVAVALGVSLGEVARRLGEKDRTVRTWDARRQIPADVRPKLEALQAEAAKVAAARSAGA